MTGIRSTFSTIVQTQESVLDKSFVKTGSGEWAVVVTGASQTFVKTFHLKQLFLLYVFNFTCNMALSRRGIGNIMTV